MSYRIKIIDYRIKNIDASDDDDVVVADDDGDSTLKMPPNKCSARSTFIV